MGAYSTRYITKREALAGIMERLLDATNEELSETLFALTCDHVLDNYIVVDTDQDIHSQFCCSECGCDRYDGDDCPVVKDEVRQIYSHGEADSCYNKKYREGR